MNLAFSIALYIIIFVFYIYMIHRIRLRARETVLLATVISFCVAANVICSKTIPLHAGTAMVVIAGISMGPEAGFMVGSLSRFICNFFDGQGPWTSWQMLSWGIIGFMSGMIFNKVVLKKRIPNEKIPLADRLSLRKDGRITLVMVPVISILAAVALAYIIYMIRGNEGSGFVGWRLYIYGFAGMVIGMLLQRKRFSVNPVNMAIYTFFSVFIIYGGIMNFGTMIMTYREFGLSELRTVYITGVPYDISHALGAAFCIFLFGDTIIRKISRVQIKFGIHIP